jgi:hypothetical protein
MFADKVRTLPESGATERCSPLYWARKAYQGQTLYLTQTFVNYGRKKFYNTDPRMEKIEQSTLTSTSGANVIKL